MAGAVSFTASTASDFAWSICCARADFVQHWDFWRTVAIGDAAAAGDWDSHGAGSARKRHNRAGDSRRNATDAGRTYHGHRRRIVADTLDFGIALWRIGGRSADIRRCCGLAFAGCAWSGLSA